MRLMPFRLGIESLMLASVLALGPSCVGTNNSSPESDARPDAADSDGVGADPAGRNVRICTGDAGEQPGVNCVLHVRDGGIYGRCRLEDEEIEAKVTGAYCCEGMTKIQHLVVADGGCWRTAPVSLLWCARCGDGECHGVENRCNCPEDCGDG